MSENTVSPTRRSLKISRREFLRYAGASAAAAAGGAALARYVPAIAAPAVPRAVSGEVAFATFEWTLPHTGSVLRAITQQFRQKYPNATVREIPIPSTGYHDQILTQLIAGTPPDIFRIDDPQLPLYIERGFLEPLDEALKEANVDTSRFMAAAKDAQRGGKTYAIVYQTNARQLIYNNQLLAEAGLSGLPKNAAEFEEYIRRSTRRDRGVFGFTFGSRSGDYTGMFNSLGPVIIGFGSHFTTPDGKPNATDPRVIEAMRFIKRIWDGDYVPKGLDGPGANALIFRGSVAMTLNGPFVFGAAAPEVRPHLFAVPSPLPSKTVMRASSWYGVAARGRNKDAAMAWLMQMLTPEGQTRIIDRERVVPALPHLVAPEVWKDDPWFKAFVDGAQRGISYLPPGLGPKAFDQIKIIGEEIERILYRNKPVEQAMGDLQKALEASLK
jgi:multiple sugar transport system substrate-binding protein